MILGRSASPDHLNASKERAEIFELWTYYDSEVKRIVGREYLGPENDAFERRGFYIGNVDVDLANSVAAALANTPPRLFSASDTVPGYWTTPFDQTIVDSLNQNSTYLKLNAESRWALSEIVDAIENKVAKCLGTPFRILNARAWYSNLGAEEFGPYGWHTDGMPNEILKIMVYLTPIDALTGGLEFMHGREIISLPVSAPGTWMLFRNSSVRHRGIAGKKRIRLVVELTLCRSVVMDTRLRTPGENAQWPKYPWIEYCEGVEPGDKVPLPPRWHDSTESGRPLSRVRSRQLVRIALVRLIQIFLILSLPITIVFKYILRYPTPTTARKLNTLDEYCRTGRSGMAAELLISALLAKL